MKNNKQSLDQHKPNTPLDSSTAKIYSKLQLLLVFSLIFYNQFQSFQISKPLYTL